MKSVRIRSFFNPYFPRKAPNTDTFYAGKCANLLAKDMNNKHQNIFLFLEIDIETKYCFYTLSGIEKTMCLFVVLKSKKKNYNLFFLDCKFGHIYTLLQYRFWPMKILLCGTYIKEKFIQNDCPKYFTNKCVFKWEEMFQIEIPVSNLPKRVSPPLLGDAFVKF